MPLESSRIFSTLSMEDSVDNFDSHENSSSDQHRHLDQAIQNILPSIKPEENWMDAPACLVTDMRNRSRGSIASLMMLSGGSLDENLFGSTQSETPLLPRTPELDSRDRHSNSATPENAQPTHIPRLGEGSFSLISGLRGRHGSIDAPMSMSGSVEGFETFLEVIEQEDLQEQTNERALKYGRTGLSWQQPIGSSRKRDHTGFESANHISSRKRDVHAIPAVISEQSVLTRSGWSDDGSQQANESDKEEVEEKPDTTHVKDESHEAIDHVSNRDETPSTSTSYASNRSNATVENIISHPLAVSIPVSSPQVVHPISVKASTPILANGTSSSLLKAKPPHLNDSEPSQPRAEGSGAHVRNRPEMQRKARQGQEHWLETVKRMRAVWEDRRKNDSAFQDPNFQRQVDLCTRLQIKSQHECILRELQFSATDGLIRALPFSDSQADSFLGWTGFQVEQSRAQEFRARIDSLFPAPLYENTLHTAFRRAGLVPEKWSAGWLGMVPFHFKADVRLTYAP